MLSRAPMGELMKLASDLKVSIAGMRRQEIIARVLEAQARESGELVRQGVLEILQDGFGFLRSPDYNYLSGPDDIYISPSQIKRFALRKGDTVAGQVRPPKDQERFFALLQVHTINGDPVDQAMRRPLFLGHVVLRIGDMQHPLAERERAFDAVGDAALPIKPKAGLAITTLIDCLQAR